MDKEEKRDEGRVENKEVILIKPYEISSLISISTHSTSFIDEEIKNLIKYMKFILKNSLSLCEIEADCVWYEYNDKLKILLAA